MDSMVVALHEYDSAEKLPLNLEDYKRIEEKVE